MTETERKGQIEWFTSLLESLDTGDIESVRASIEGAIKLLEKDAENRIA